MNLPLFQGVCLFILGLLLGHYFSLSPLLPLALGAAAALTARTARAAGSRQKQKWLIRILTASLIMTAGAWWIRRAERIPADDIANFISGRPAAVEGIIRGAPEFRRHGARFTLACRKIIENSREEPVSGSLAVRFHGQVNAVRDRLACGNRILIRSTIRPPRERGNPGEISRRKILAADGIRAVTRVYLPEDLILLEESGRRSVVCRALDLKKRFQRIIRDSLPSLSGRSGSIQSVLLEAILLGEKSALPFRIRENFRATGLIHILVVSGLHVAFIWLLGNFIFSPFSIRIRHALIIPLVFGYVLVTGAGTAAVRAGVMASIYSLAYVFNQPRNTYAALAAAALLLLLINPLSLFTPGFQLSFLIVLSIISFTPLLNDKLGFISSKIRNWVTVPIAAQLGALPLIAYYFHSIAPLALLTNIFMVPLAALIVSLGFIAMLAGLISTSIAELINYPNRFLILGLIKAVGAVARLPFSSLRIEYFPPIWTLSWYLLLFSAAGYRFFAKRWRRKIFISILILAGAGWAGGYLVPEKLTPMSGYFFNTDSGDFTLLRGNAVPTILIGADDDPFGDIETVIRPFLSRARLKEIDYLILTETGIDHLNTVRKLVETVKIKTILDHPAGPSSASYLRFQKLLSDNGIRYRRLAWGDKIIAGETAITVLWPRRAAAGGEPGAESLVFRLDWRDISFLFPSQAEVSVQEELAADSFHLKADILKLPCRGSRTHVSIPFLKKVNPQLGLIVQGRKYFGRYPNDVGEILEEMGAEVHRTGEDGCLIVDSDGYRVSARGYKKKTE